MENKRYLIIKKVNEERLFRNWSEFWKWYQRQSGSSKNVFDRLDRSVLSARDKEKFMPPLKGTGTFKVYGDKSHFKFQMSIGKFIRTSGSYQINIIALQKWQL
jgi:hypothetical protein